MAGSPNRAKDLFLKALDLASPEERAAFLAEACGADVALRQHIDAMLEAQAASGSFLEKPAAALATIDSVVDSLPVDRSLLAGASVRIGPYKLLEQIGEGGMGVVYVAEQQEPVRRLVALKIIKPGMDTSQVLARFEAERQALAMMDHQNIAKVFDAGTTEDGRPYFVMELVKGTPITAYCDAAKLATRDRLELFVAVCQAIQHAHQKGVIHRDIKPTNVLVALYDDRPVPKVIDFGIAKAAQPLVTHRTLHTGFGTIVGTPEYMSPEQATFNQLDVDTRSDVYSLGVVLYELLTGTTPVDKARLKQAALLEVLRVVREEEPPPPSAKLSTMSGRAAVAAVRGSEAGRLAQMMRGELDWIVMKSLEKDRKRRYESAAGLARDIQAHLSNDIVEARPPTAAYRLRKFVSRHRGTFSAAALLVAALVVGMIGTTLGMVQARRAEEETRGAQMLAESRKIEADAGRNEAVLALARNEGLRLVLQSELLRREQPGLALLLGIEGAQRHPGILADNALLAALDAHVEERTFLGHTGPVAGLSFSADSRRLATASLDGSVRIWDVDSGKQIFVFDEPISVPTKTKHGDTTIKFTPMYVAVQFDPEGKRLLATLPQGLYRVLDIATRKIVVSLPPGDDARLISGHKPICPARYSPDGRWILTGYGEASLWNAADGSLVRTFKGHEGPVNWAEFDADGKRIVTASADRTARIWDAESGILLKTLPAHVKNEIVLARFSHDGRKALTVAESGGSFNRRDPAWCRLWDVETGKQLGELGNPQGFAEFPPLAQFSPDDKRIVTADFFGGDIGLHLWDSADCKQLRLVPFPRQNAAAAFTPDGNRLAIAAMGTTVDVRDARTLNSIETLRGARGSVQSVAYSPDGQRLAVSDGTGAIRIWVVAGEADRRRGRWSMPFLALSDDGRRIATKTADPTEIAVCDTVTGRQISRMRGKKPSEITYARFRPDGRTIVFLRNIHIGESAWIGDVDSGRVVAALSAGTNYMGGVDLSADGRLAVSWGDQAETRIWSAITGEQLAICPPAKGDWNRGPNLFLADGRRFLTGQATGVRVRDSATGKETSVLKAPGSTSTAGLYASSRDGRHVVAWYHAERDGVLARVWDVETLRESAALRPKVAQGNLETIAAEFSDDGAWIVTTCNDNTVRLWETATGRELHVFRGHEAYAASAAISPDKTRVVTASVDKTVRLWDAATGEPVAVFRGHDERLTLARFIPEGRVLSVDEKGAIRVWPVDPLKEARARAPRSLTPADRIQYEVPDSARP